MQSHFQFTNKLIDETSPYLLQHAHNPVDWYPWGDDAFERARAEDKPLLVSIGYSACHWCHVMEHESFEDESVAAIMNKEFINIKVDMEERPDVDQIYMNFVQMTTGRGGWPMNVFITPDKRPFFGGTYFPPQPRYGMPSWRQILMSIAEAYRDRRDDVEASSMEMVAQLKRMSIGGTGGGGIDEKLAENAFGQCVRSFDGTNGGFGGAPKFPQAMTLEFLLRYHNRTGDAKALEMVTHTLDKMACGGMYDQIGGGFHRYSVDSFWLVPHFEKMLYDNAQLARVYLHAFQVTNNESYKRTVVETLEYVRREMLDASGGFYSTQDADSEGVEGKFFVWSPEEVTAVIGEENARIFNFFYDISEGGNFEGDSIPNRRYTFESAAAALKISELELIAVIADAKTKLFDARESRIKPARDEKVITAWNGLMMAAFADAGVVLNIPDYIDIARNNATFVSRELWKDGRLLRTWKEGRAKLIAYVEDYANVADGLLELYRVTGEMSFFVEAKRMADLMITEFWDEQDGGFYFTSNDHEELIVRNKDLYDNATPSGNSVAADVLARIARLSGEDRYARFAITTLRLSAGNAGAQPQGFGRMLATSELMIAPRKEVAIVGTIDDEVRSELFSFYRPTLITAISEKPETDEDVIALFKERRQSEKGLSIFVCEDNVCGRPVSTAGEMREQLKS